MSFKIFVRVQLPTTRFWSKSALVSIFKMRVVDALPRIFIVNAIDGAMILTVFMYVSKGFSIE